MIIAWCTLPRLHPVDSLPPPTPSTNRQLCVCVCFEWVRCMFMGRRATVATSSRSDKRQQQKVSQRNTIIQFIKWRSVETRNEKKKHCNNHLRAKGVLWILLYVHTAYRRQHLQFVPVSVALFVALLHSTFSHRQQRRNCNLHFQPLHTLFFLMLCTINLPCATQTSHR